MTSAGVSWLSLADDHQQGGGSLSSGSRRSWSVISSRGASSRAGGSLDGQQVGQLVSSQQQGGRSCSSGSAGRCPSWCRRSCSRSSGSRRSWSVISSRAGGRARQDRRGGVLHGVGGRALARQVLGVVSWLSLADDPQQGGGSLSSGSRRSWSVISSRAATWCPWVVVRVSAR